MSDLVYVVTDVELDGFSPGDNSMLSFASVAVTASGRQIGEFEAVLDTLPGASPEPGTMAWWSTQPPAAWAAARENPEPPEQVMPAWVSWVESLGPCRCFVACPVAFDGVWVDYYLRRFTSKGLVMGPNVPDTLFDPVPPLCLRTLALASTGGAPDTFTVHALPAAWFGEVAHTHRAVDDARGYANLLVTLLAL